MRPLHPVASAVLLGVALLLATPSNRQAHAGAPNRSCASPEIFPNANINVVVVPFVDETGKLSSTSRELSLMLQQQLLAMLAPLGSVGTVRLLGADADCSVPRLRSQLRPAAGKALLFVSGYFFEEDDGIKLQTVVTVVADGELPGFSLTARNATFHAPLSNAPLVFSTRRLSPGDISEIGAAFRQFARLYRSPSERSPSRPIPVEETARHGVYSVRVVRGPWMLVDASFGQGWVRAGDLIDGARLGQIMPELFFVKAAAGFLRTHQTMSKAERALAQPLFEDAALAFEREAVDDEAPRAWIANARVLTLLATSGPSRQSVDSARTIVHEAIEKAPEDASLRVMRAALTLRTAEDGSEPGSIEIWRQAERDLLIARALGAESWPGPSNLRMLAELELPAEWTATDQRLVMAERPLLAAILGVPVGTPGTLIAEGPRPHPAPPAYGPPAYAGVASAAVAPREAPVNIEAHFSGGLSVCCGRLGGSAAFDLGIRLGRTTLLLGAHAVFSDPSIVLVPLGFRADLVQARLPGGFEIGLLGGVRGGVALAEQAGRRQWAIFAAPEVGIKLSYAERFFVALPLSLPLLVGAQQGRAAIFQPQLQVGVGFEPGE
jgi:hypothetical protein